MSAKYPPVRRGTTKILPRKKPLKQNGHKPSRQRDEIFTPFPSRDRKDPGQIATKKKKRRRRSV